MSVYMLGMDKSDFLGLEASNSKYPEASTVS